MAIPNPANSTADATFTARVEIRWPIERPATAPTIPLDAAPSVAPIQTPTGAACDASVAVVIWVLSPISAIAIASAIEPTTAGAVAPRHLGVDLVVGLVVVTP